MAEVLTQSIILMLIVILGYILKKVKIFGNTDYRVMTKCVMYVTLPCTIINGFSRFEWDNSLLLIPFLGLGINIVLQVAGYVMCRRRDDQDKIYYMLNTPSFSTGTFAMPFIQNSLGVEGVVAACIFDVGGTLMPSGLSYVCASAVLKEKKERVNAAFVLKKLFTSPAFDANLLMIIMKISGIALPGFVTLFTSKVSSANTFICMFMIGMMFELKFQSENIIKVGKIIICRLIISTLSAVMIMNLLPFEFALRKALTVVVFSPIGALPLAFTDKLEGDVELASFVNSISIVLSMIIMTALMVLI